MNSDEEGKLVELLSDLEERMLSIRVTLGLAKKPEVASSQSGPTYASYTQAILDGRASITRHLPADLFADPALDILLDLFVAVERRERRTIKMVTLAARTPFTTALRWIRMLEKRGFIERGDDPDDRRVVTLRMLPPAHAAMEAWLADVSSIPLRRGLRG